MATFPSEYDKELSIAIEYLGLTTKALELITGKGNYEPWEFWGLNEEDNPVFDPDNPGQTFPERQKLGLVHLSNRD